MSRIGRLFERLRAKNEAALVAYLTAGDPSPERTPEFVFALERGGADLIELGVPFSDPVADGPVIQKACDRALAAGTTLAKVLDAARRIREKSEIPLVLFSYLNPLFRYGFDRLASDAAQAGVDGCLITDLSVEEAEDPVARLHAAGLDTIFLAAPTSTPTRIEAIARYSSGFVYLVSRTGVTGERDSLSGTLAPLVAAVRAKTQLPIAVGFGISRPEHCAEVARLADGVVVGSSIVRLIEEWGADAGILPRLEGLAQGLKQPLRR